MAAADTDAARDAIATAEESRKAIQNFEPLLKDGSCIDDVIKENRDGVSESKYLRETSDNAEKGSERPGYAGVYDHVSNLPMEFYHYYHGSNTDVGTLIGVLSAIFFQICPRRCCLQAICCLPQIWKPFFFNSVSQRGASLID